MKVGMPCAMDNIGEKPDHQIYWDHLKLADLAEPLGFDALWTVEHHFTGYAQVPDPALLLTYLAARTSRIYLGASVFVLPWHDPIRVAEQIAMLDVLSRGRIIVGFGRGAASVEYNGFGIPMEESRARFAEATQVVHKALTNEVFSWDGEFYKIPPVSIRPRPISHPERRLYASTVSPESAEIMAGLGLGMLIIPGKDWPTSKADYDRYREMTIAAGHAPRPAVCVVMCSIDEDRSRAVDRAKTYMSRTWESIDAHYKFSDGHLGNVKTYEFYSRLAKTYQKLTSDSDARNQAADQYVQLHLTGTPRECLEQIEAIHRQIDMEQITVQFHYGGLPIDESERMMRMFSDQVLPILHNDPAFALQGEPVLV